MGRHGDSQEAASGRMCRRGTDDGGGARFARRCEMLVLSRKVGEEIAIGDDIKMMVIEIRGGRVRLSIVAPREITIHRKEVYEAIQNAKTK